MMVDFDDTVLIINQKLLQSAPYFYSLVLYSGDISPKGGHILL